MERPPPRTIVLLVAMALAAAPSTGRSQSDPAEPGRSGAPATTIGIDYAYSTFAGAIDSWHATAFSIERRSAEGSVIARLNLARRFAIFGAQYEVDAYPRLGERTFAYLNVGYSRATIFPERRYGAEIIRSLPHANEASIGIRSLDFPTERVTLFTGSVGRYTGNYWLSLRPFIRDEPAGGLSASAALSVRRYYGNPDTYIGARIGAGTVPTDALYPSQLSRERSTSIGVQASRPGSPRSITTWTFNYESDKNPVQTLNRWEFGVGVKVRF